MNTAETIDSSQYHAFRFYPAERTIFKPREDITVSQHAERYRVVTKGPAKGLWTNAYSPFAVFPMDLLLEPHIRRIYLCWAPQTAKTQVALNFLNYVIDQDPDDFFYVMADEKTLKRKMSGTILPMLRNSPRTASYLSPREDDTSTYKVKFINGMELHAGWATSIAVMGDASFRYIVLDEVDKYPLYLGKDINSVGAAEQRANAFPDTCKLIYMSTPTEPDGYMWRKVTEEADVIMDLYVRCPFCGHEQVMVFDNFVWPKDITDPRVIQRKKLASYQCAACPSLWDDVVRNKAVARWRWGARAEVERPENVALLMPAWYSRNFSLSRCVAQYMRGKDDNEEMRTFVTQIKSEPYVEKVTTKGEDDVLRQKTGLPAGIVPREAVALTCGIDVQEAGFWYVVRAWAANLDSWLVSYGYKSMWSEIETLLFNTQFQREDAGVPLGIFRCAIDTGGGESGTDDWSRTEEIYNWLRKYTLSNIVFGVKGSSHPMLRRVKVSNIDTLPSGKKIPGGLELRILDTGALKDTIHWRMTRIEGESQRFFLHADTGLDYVKQLLAEEKKSITRNKKKKTWVQIGRRPNHLLDCEVYAAACAAAEWFPSLQMLAQREEAEREELKNKKHTTIKTKKERASRW